MIKLDLWERKGKDKLLVVLTNGKRISFPTLFIGQIVGLSDNEITDKLNEQLKIMRFIDE